MNDRLRIGDAERDEAARELGEHFALGRITADEHTERLEQIWAARTAAELAPAFRDLPRSQPSRPTAAGSSANRSPADRGRRSGRLALPPMPHVPFPFKVLVAIVLVWWGFHHPLFLLVAAVVYVVLIRRFTHRRRWTRYHARWH